MHKDFFVIKDNFKTYVKFKCYFRLLIKLSISLHLASTRIVIKCIAT